MRREGESRGKEGQGEERREEVKRGEEGRYILLSEHTLGISFRHYRLCKMDACFTVRFSGSCVLKTQAHISAESTVNRK